MEHLSNDEVYIRQSLMRPKAGQRERALALLEELIDFYSLQPGYIDAYTLTSPEGDGQNEIGRLTLWRDDRDADRVATMQHVLSLRADLLRCIESGSDVERSFHAKAGPLGAVVAF
jgi:hypothetical protein